MAENKSNVIGDGKYCITCRITQKKHGTQLGNWKESRQWLPRDVLFSVPHGFLFQVTYRYRLRLNSDLQTHPSLFLSLSLHLYHLLGRSKWCQPKKLMPMFSLFSSTSSLKVVLELLKQNNCVIFKKMKTHVVQQ